SETTSAHLLSQIKWESVMIARQLFIGSLAVQHYLDTNALRLLENTPLRKDGRRTEGFVLMPSNCRDLLKDVLGLGIDEVCSCFSLCNHLIHERSFVDTLLVVAGGDRVDLRLCWHHRCHETNNRRGIQSTG